jgi:hypothetical protein
MKNCLLIIENKPTFLKAAIKHFWYKDKADFDVLVVYEPACNTSKADLEKVIIEGNNPNFLVENIYNVNELWDELKPVLRTKGLTASGEKFGDIYRMKTYFVGPLYFKLLKDYDDVFMCDDDVMYTGPIKDFMSNRWVFKNYGFGAIATEINEVNSTTGKKEKVPYLKSREFSKDDFENIKSKMLSDKVNLGLGDWVISVLHNRVFKNHLNIDRNEYNSMLVSAGNLTYANENFDDYVQCVINLYNQEELCELYEISMNQCSIAGSKRGERNNYRKVHCAFWMLNETFIQTFAHVLISKNTKMVCNDSRMNIIWPNDLNKGRKDTTQKHQPVLPKAEKLLQSYTQHYACGPHKQLYCDALEKIFDDCNYQGEKSSQFYFKGPKTTRKSGDDNKFGRYLKALNDRGIKTDNVIPLE